MRLAIIPAIAATTAALVATASPARADDQSYLNSIGPTGLSPSRLLRMGHDYCDNIRYGMSPDQAYMLLGLIANTAPNLRDAAQHELCPETLH